MGNILMMVLHYPLKISVTDELQYLVYDWNYNDLIKKVHEMMNSVTGNVCSIDNNKLPSWMIDFVFMALYEDKVSVIKVDYRLLSSEKREFNVGD